MKAAWIEAFGAPEVIRIGELPDPTRADGEVLVRITASTLNHRDIYLRRGEAGRIGLPVVLGSDGAAVVVEADSSSAVRAGQRIAVYPVLSCGSCPACLAGDSHKCRSFGMVGGERDGTHAELVSLPESCVVPMPESLDDEVGASISLAGLTAWNMVVDEGRAKSGEHALVLGASGGVGVFVVLLLKRLGVIVHAVTSDPSKRTSLLKLGADFVLDDSPGSVLRHVSRLPGRGVDLAVNPVGGATWRYTLPAVRAAGRILVCGTVRSPVAEIDMRHVFYRSLRIIGCSMGTRASLSAILAAAADDPLFRPPVAERIRLDALPDAHRRMEGGRLMGKIVIRP